MILNFFRKMPIALQILFQVGTCSVPIIRACVWKNTPRYFACFDKRWLKENAVCMESK